MFRMFTRTISLFSGNMELSRKLVFWADLNKELNRETIGFGSFLTRKFLVKENRGAQFRDPRSLGVHV